MGNQAVWSSIVDGLIFNPEHAIPKFWVDCKSNGLYLGAPIIDELAREDGTVEQAFSSGACICWSVERGAWLE